MSVSENISEIQVLKNVSVFKNMSDEELELIFKHLDKEQYPRGHKVLREGEKGGNFYIVKSGKLKVSVRLPGDTVKILGTIESGSSFGEIAILSEDLVSADVAAVDTTYCYVLNREKLNAFRVFYPILYIKMEEAIAKMAVKKIRTALATFHEFSKKSLPFTTKSSHTFVPNKRIKSHPITISDVRFDALDEMGNFSHFSAEELNEVFNFGQFILCDKGHILKDIQNYFCIVFSGAIQVYDDLIPKLYIVQPGEFFAQPAFFDSSIQLSVAAREKTKLFLMSKNDLQLLKEKHFEAWIKLQHTNFKSIVNVLYLLDRRLLCFEGQCYASTKEETCAE